MSSPTFSDALSYVVDAQAEILSAVADWKSYADAAAEAYSQAYEDQGRVLGSVNKRLEEMRKEDAERMTLALTILTAGVAGPIASVLVKDKAAKVFEKLAENLQGKASKTAEFIRRPFDGGATRGQSGAHVERCESICRWRGPFRRQSDLRSSAFR